MFVRMYFYEYVGEHLTWRALGAYLVTSLGKVLGCRLDLSSRARRLYGLT